MTEPEPRALPKPELVALEALKPHPRNYRRHPEDQLEHLAASLREHGLYRNVVAARDGTILAGHGLVLAARKAGWTEILVLRLDLDAGDARALKILTGDNEIGHLAEQDDRALTEMLRELAGTDDGLLGTGYDKQMLAALAMVTRPAAEIQSTKEAAHWVGMPEFGDGAKVPSLAIQFLSEADRLEFIRRNDLRTSKGKGELQLICWWPDKDKDDLASVKFEVAPPVSGGAS